MKRLYQQLCQYEVAAWQRGLDMIGSSVHEVDRNATRIWFAFWPLDLFLALDSAPDPATAARRFGLMGRWRLAEQIDESHRFLYGHRYWPQVKQAIAAERAWPADLPALVTEVADAAAQVAGTARDMATGISAVGLMTLRQTGVDAFAAAPGRVLLPEAVLRASPQHVLRRRAKDDWQGPFGFLRGIKKRWTITFDEHDPAACFAAINGQEIATAAQQDKREYRSRDGRCTPGEGPIPVECRAASCGTCWVGVLAGAEKLSPVVDRDEGRRMQVFGYQTGGGSKPMIRLACQARACGAVTVVIPPWNGMYGNMLTTKGLPQRPS